MHELDKEFAVHAAVCAERYKEINDSLEHGRTRMRRIEVGLWVIAAAVLLGPGFAAELIKNLIGV